MPSFVNLARSQVCDTERPPYLFAARSPRDATRRAGLSATADPVSANHSVCRKKRAGVVISVLYRYAKSKSAGEVALV